jgi:hypothetical protein
MTSFVSESERLALVAARAVAPLLGGTLDAGSPEETWRAWVNLACGLRLTFIRDYRGKGEILASLPRPGYSGESRPCGKIGADLSRDPVKLAADIERRLLRDARAAADKARADWAAQEYARGAMESLAAEFGAIPGVRAKLERPGAADQRLHVDYYESDKGRLSAVIYNAGSVSIERASIYGGTDRLKALLAVLAS